MLPIDAVVADMAASLRAKYSLRTPDALQVGTAIVNRCEALLTNDNGLKRVSELSILVLDELEL
jgi:predicted nucleic acid-binding protein